MGLLCVPFFKIEFILCVEGGDHPTARESQLSSQLGSKEYDLLLILRGLT